MKILEAFDKEVKGKKYYRYRINLPKKVVEESGLINKELKVTTEKKEDYYRRRLVMSRNLTENRTINGAVVP